jgi:WbqC-like protein family
MTVGTVVAIHQPNFLPWLGFFHKLASSDVFILLDTVDFSRGSRTNRVQVLAADTPSWLTVPVRRPEHGEPRIVDARIDDSRPWRRKALRTLEVSYGGRRGFTETFALVEPVLSKRTDRLAALNEAGIRRIAAALSLDGGKLVRASDLSAAGSSSELLASLVHAVGGDVYLSGAGAEGYLEDEPFARREIEVRVQKFKHPDYAQAAPAPIHGLSVIDAMMNLGVSDTQRLLT